MNAPDPCEPEDAAQALDEVRLELTLQQQAYERSQEQLQAARRQRAKFKAQAEALSEALAAQLSASSPGGPLARWTGGRAKVSERSAVQILVAEVEASGLFDAAWYLRTNLEAAQAGIRPAEHYVTRGWRDGYGPGPRFSSKKYLAAHPEAKESGLPPLVHHLRNGGAPDRPYPGSDDA